MTACALAFGGIQTTLLGDVTDDQAHHECKRRHSTVVDGWKMYTVALPETVRGYTISVCDLGRGAVACVGAAAGLVVASLLLRARGVGQSAVEHP